MREKYSVRITAKFEGIEYIENNIKYRFDAKRKNQTWIVYLPCTRGDGFEDYEFSNTERDRILSRIHSYLKVEKICFGLLTREYKVIFERETE